MLSHEFELIYKKLKPRLSLLENKSIFITGGTGFFGTWILSFVKWANESKNTNIKLTILSRNPKKYNKEYPKFLNSNFSFVKGDINSSELSIDKKFDYFIHAATDSSDRLKSQNKISDEIVEGTKNALILANNLSCERFLNISSGAIYGDLNIGSPVTEEFILNSKNRTSYGEGKFKAEQELFKSKVNSKIKIISARCFAFIGPYLSLDEKFATSMFINSALNNETIKIKGTGLSTRSYMYMADLVLWLLTLLVAGKPGESYNVGSDEEITVKDLANLISLSSNQSEVKILGESESESYYVPNINKCKSQLGLCLNYDNKLAVEKTLNWFKNQI